MDDKESGVHGVSHEPILEDVSRTCQEINGALAVLVVCLDFLAERTTGVPNDAVTDAAEATQRIRTATAALRKTCVTKVTRAA